jgi:SAM-dependent methyltransferase
MDDADEFFDAFATTYDARHAENPQKRDPRTGWLGDDAAFYRELARDADGPALEVGVGTGRVYLELLNEGLDVDGIDVSERMLERCREKARTDGLDVSVRVADVTTFDPDREYGLVYVPARAFNHLPTLADQRAALDRIREALAPGGTLALNTFVPGFEVVAEEYGDPRAEFVERDGERYRLVRETRLHDEVEQVARIRQAVYRADDEGQANDDRRAAADESTTDDEHVAARETPLALIPKRQFELLFETAGFGDWTVYGGFDREPLTDVTDEQVWVVEQ